MISTNEKLANKQRKILGPLGRLLLKVFRWEIKGKIPDLEKMILIGIPHTAMRDAWYALLAVWGIPISIIFSKSGIFPLISHLKTFSNNLPRGPNIFLCFFASFSFVEIIIFPQT